MAYYCSLRNNKDCIVDKVLLYKIIPRSDETLMVKVTKLIEIVT